MKHTPGPWKVIERKAWTDPKPISPNFARFCVGAEGSLGRGPSLIADISADENGTVIRHVSGHKDDEIPGNAHLIAAAPEMLAALDSIEVREPDADGLVWITIRAGTGHATIPCGGADRIVGQTLLRFKDILEDAKAKARGES